jgi:photosystem II stability/assembly factor-like uncharacterized protein
MKAIAAHFSAVAVRRFSSIVFGLASVAAFAQDAARPEMRITPAEHVPAAASSMMLSAALAGTRIVAVGDHGVVLLTDDGGKSFRQAHSVPVSSTLTGVSFVDATHGWAVGHWGVVLNSVDGGENWTLQRSDLAVDQPLFSVHFKNAKVGWAVGLWSLMLHTVDGGTTWTTVKLPPPPGAKKADRNLYRIFADSAGKLFITCEQGRVMQSADDGATWNYIETGYTGSFWTGVVLQDGVLLVGGLRGTIYRSTDGGRTWSAAQSSFKSSVTDMLQLADKSIVAVGLDGVTLVSHDDGATFSGNQSPDRVPLTALSKSTPSGSSAVTFSANGPIS